MGLWMRQESATSVFVYLGSEFDSSPDWRWHAWRLPCPAGNNLMIYVFVWQFLVVLA